MAGTDRAKGISPRTTGGLGVCLLSMVALYEVADRNLEGWLGWTVRTASAVAMVIVVGLFVRVVFPRPTGTSSLESGTETTGDKQ
jgi:hypothetical protein